MLILGIDPGSTGGLAWLSVDRHQQRLAVRFARMPMRSDGLDARALWNLLMNATHRPDVVRVERVGFLDSRSNIAMNRTSHFAMGKGVGRLEAALMLAGLAWEDVAPNSWQARTGARREGKGKEGTFAALARWFPGASWVPQGCRKPHDGIAEAALIALSAALERGLVDWNHPALCGRSTRARVKRTQPKQPPTSSEAS